MAKENDTIEHPVTGEKITFLETSEETGGEYARAELRVRPHGFLAAPTSIPSRRNRSRYARARSPW